MEKINVFWHRRDLRIQDNTGLYYALTSELPVLPIFIFDTNILSKLEEQNDARVTFIHEQIVKLNEEYSQKGSGLKVFNCTPEEAFNELLDTYEIAGIYTNRDYEPEAITRDSAIQELVQQHGAEFYTFKDQVIFEKGEILTDKGEPYKVFTPFKNKWLQKYKDIDHKSIDTQKHLKNTFQLKGTDIPTIEELGFEPSELTFPDKTYSEQIVEKYADDRDFPAKKGTTRLGVHLRFGTISVRELAAQTSSLSETYLSELIWREFYMMILAYFPEVVDKAFKSKYDQIKWINDEDQFIKWCEGKTGYPIVDAGMRELNATGYMHNRVRMVVSSFLTKHLLIDWRWGERYFAKKLLDYELASNNGGWQWAAGTGTDAQPYFRVFNPKSQQEKFDPDYSYIKKWVPEFDTPKYPKPIVDHKQARVRAIETYKEAVS